MKTEIESLATFDRIRDQVECILPVFKLCNFVRERARMARLRLNVKFFFCKMPLKMKKKNNNKNLTHLRLTK